MRVLNTEETKAVSGGTFCLIGGLLRGLFSCFKPVQYNNNCYNGGDKGGYNGGYNGGYDKPKGGRC